MFTKSINKVTFQDPQLDDYVLENSVLKSKLQSKVDALSIMGKELDKCSMERDKYKVLVEQFKCKKSIPLKSQETHCNIYKFSPTNSISGGEMLTRTRDQNNLLKLEVEMLHSKLEEATGDIVALRKQLQKKEIFLEENNASKKCNGSSFKDHEQLIQELEKIRKKYQQIQLDYRATLDEKEELVSDRDYYKNKVQRLNHQISYILCNRAKVTHEDNDDPPKPIVDIDALVTENKYLHERITQLQIEKEIVKRTLTKYKTLLDNRNKNYSLNLKKGFADVMNQKQVREFLAINSKTGSKQSSAAELQCLCQGLFEALNDKSIALQHQRKTNQILANRITELEKTLDSWCNGQKYIPIFPSQMLLDEFFPDPGSVKSDDIKDKRSNGSQNSSENNKEKYLDSDEEINKGSSDDSTEEMKNNESNCVYGDNRNKTNCKTILPRDLEELVNEAIAELRPVG